MRFFCFVLMLTLPGCALPPINDGNENIPEISKTVVTKKNLGEALNYQQSSYKLDDPEGDEAILTVVKGTAKEVIFNTVTGNGYSSLTKKLYQIRKEAKSSGINNPIDGFNGYCGELSLASSQITPEPIIDQLDQLPTNFFKMHIEFPPSEGICHRWSTAYLEHPLQFPYPYIYFSKLLIALAYGDSSVYFITGKEQALLQWIFSQQDRSVSIVRIFQTSYLLNNGDCYLSVLTICNVISRFWSYQNRERLCISHKLQVITSSEGTGDNFGTWYHFWCLVLFGYCHSGFTAWLVGSIETIGSHMVSHSEERDEDFVNSHAGSIGSSLRNYVRDWQGPK